MPDEGGENKICQFLSFYVYFWTFWRVGLSFYWTHKGDEGADTDPMFHFSVPNTNSRRIIIKPKYKFSFFFKKKPAHWLKNPTSKIILWKLCTCSYHLDDQSVTVGITTNFIPSHRSCYLYFGCNLVNQCVAHTHILWQLSANLQLHIST